MPAGEGGCHPLNTVTAEHNDCSQQEEDEDQHRDCQGSGSSLEEEMATTQVLLPGKSHGQSELIGLQRSLDGLHLEMRFH